jgi:hypothetical protein
VARLDPQADGVAVGEHRPDVLDERAGSSIGANEAEGMRSS